MSHDNWEDELLNFDYSNPVPDERPKARINKSDLQMFQSSQQVDDAIRREETRAQRLQEEYRKIREAARAQQEAPVEIPRRVQAAASEQEEAYRQFREEYADKKPVQSAAKVARRTASRAAEEVFKVTGFYKFTKILSVPYVLLLAVFAVVITLMDVLPFFYWVAMLVVLGLLSVIVVIQLRKPNIKKWAKILSTSLAVVLMLFYGLGTAYALGTISLLGNNSVKNEDKVAHITKEPFNVCMTGMDVYGPIDEPGRSDVNMIVTVNPNTATILMTSIPRDYEVRMPDMGYATDKLTHTGFYSVDTTIQAEEDLLSTDINYYVKVNFTTVRKFITAIGGIDVYSEQEFVPEKFKEWTVKEGWNHMNGKQALAFARERHSFIDGDNQRIKNQQKVFEAMIKKATSSKTVVLNYNSILSSMNGNFEMSLSSREIRSLLKLQLAKNPKWKIFKNTLIGGGATMPTYSTGSTKCYVMTQDPTSIANAQELINAVLNGQKLTKDEDDNVIVKAETETETETEAEGE